MNTEEPLWFFFIRVNQGFYQCSSVVRFSIAETEEKKMVKDDFHSQDAGSPGGDDAGYTIYGFAVFGCSIPYLTLR